MPTLSDLFNLDPNVERLSLLPRMRGSLPSDYGVSPEMMGSVMLQDPRVKNRFMPDLVAPKILYDFIRAIKAPGRAARGEVLDEEEALNTALNMFGGGLATSGSVPIGALGMSARTAPAGTMPLKEVAKSPLGFYSKVEEATLPLQNKGTGSQYLAQIEKTPGVKPEELEYTGLADFLRSKQTVTKPEIQDYLAANRVNLQEVRLGEISPEQSAAIAQAKNRYREITNSIANTRQQVEEGLISSQEARAILEPLSAERGRLDNQILSNTAPATKFSSYTLPGGENYREILLTLPERTRVKSLEEVNDGRSQRGAAPLTQERYDELVARGGLQDYAEGTFKSSHFDQPNILAHMRVNDRVVDGKKTLFIEEIQSDWHQAGRKKGYATGKPTFGVRLTMNGSRVNADGQAVFATREEAQALADRTAGAPNFMAAEIYEIPPAGVPDAPFKTTWHELSLKRAIQEASEKGYDQIAFTTGKTQAERYDLSKQVNSLKVERNTDGNFSLRIKRTDQDRTFEPLKSNITQQELSDYIGKDLAEKVAKDAEGTTDFNKVYSGLDLQVGGEGMKGFYDQILPKSLEKLGKKFDAKVGKTFIEGERTRDASGIPSMYPEKIEVWKMDITPQMRESVLTKGQPLFAGSPAFPIANQDPLMQFLGMGEAENDPLMQFLGQK